jgi:hypothetical protein
VASRLRATARIGILYATGNSLQVAMQDAEGEACISKPYQADELVRGMNIVAEIVASGASSSPLPHGFHMLRRPYSQPVAYSDGQ